MIRSQASTLLLLVVSVAVYGAEGASPVVSPSAVLSSPSPSPISSKSSNSFIPDSYSGSLTASPSPSPSSSSTGVKITRDEAKFLVKEFDRAQRNEMRALEHRFKIQKNEQAASQKVRKKEFDEKEKVALHKFFTENRKGSERREYVRSYMDRKKALNAIFKDEKEQMKRDQDVRKESLAHDHKSKMTEFRAITEKGERPPEALWPKPGL